MNQLTNSPQLAEAPAQYEYKHLIPAVGVVENEPGYATGDKEIASAHNVSQFDLVSAGTMGVAEIFMGTELMSNPGVANKLFAAGLIIKGVKDQYEAISPAPKDGSMREAIRSRIRSFGNSLVEKNDNPGTLRERLKRGAGNELLTLQDIGYRNRLNRAVGSLFLFGAGLEMYDTDTTTGKVAGIVTAGAAVAETIRAQWQGSQVAGEATTRQTAIANASTSSQASSLS